MPRSPCRLTQWSCVALTVLGLLPWALMCGALVYRAIHSPVPLTMSVVAWVAMLVPLWVIWFGSIAWHKRHESAFPAMVMAAPLVMCTAVFLLMPAAASAH